MNILIILLRLVHILAGVLWVGTALINTFFLSQTAAATGEAGQKFMVHLIGRARLRAWISWASYLTILAGAALYWIDSQGFTSAWQASGPGIGFGLGAVAAVIGFGFGQMAGKNASAMANIAGQLQGAPTPEQAAALARAQSKMASSSSISTAFLILALALMATARYWLV